MSLGKIIWKRFMSWVFKFLNLVLALPLLYSCVNKIDIDLLGAASTLPPEKGYITHLGQSSLAAGINNDWSNEVVADEQGSVYFCGVTQSQLGASAAQGEDIIVGKLNPNGEREWLVQYDAANGFVHNGNERCRSIILSGGYVYIVGNTNSSMVNAGVAVPLNVNNTRIVYSKLSLSGEIIWTRQLDWNFNGNPGTLTTWLNECWSMTADRDGDIYLGCSSRSPVVESNPSIAQNIVVFKINTDGVVTNVRHIGPQTATDSAEITTIAGNQFVYDIVVDTEKNIYVAGSTTGNLKEVSAGGGDAYIMKLNSSFDIVWLSHFGRDTLPVNEGLSNDVILSLSLSSNNRLYFAGTTQSNYAGAANASPNFAIMWGHVNTQSGTLVDVNVLPESINANVANFRMKPSPNGQLLFAGYFTGAQMFEPKTEGAFSDSFIFSLNPQSKSVSWSKQLNSVNVPEIDSSGGDFIYNLFVNSKGSIFASGGTYGNFSEISNDTSFSDMFFVKLNAEGALE
jgi:hypothetical protein